MLNKYFKDWFFQIVWVLDYPGVRLRDLPHVSVEVDAKKANPDAATYFVDYIVPTEDEGMLIKMQDQTRH